MFSFFWKKKSQSTAEYAIIIAVVIGALMAMQTYFKRGVQSGVRYAVDRLQMDVANSSQQYEPYYLESNYTTTVGSQTTPGVPGYVETEQTSTTGYYNRTVAGRQVNRTGEQVIHAH